MSCPGESVSFPRQFSATPGYSTIAWGREHTFILPEPCKLGAAASNFLSVPPGWWISSMGQCWEMTSRKRPQDSIFEWWNHDHYSSWSIFFHLPNTYLYNTHIIYIYISCEYVQYVIHVMYLWGTPSFQLPGFSETKPCRFRPPEEFGFRDMASQAVLMVLGLSCHSVAMRGTKSTTDNTEKRTCQMYIYIFI